MEILNMGGLNPPKEGKVFLTQKVKAAG